MRMVVAQNPKSLKIEEPPITKRYQCDGRVNHMKFEIIWEETRKTQPKFKNGNK